MKFIPLPAFYNHLLMQRYRILLADDHTILRHGLKKLVESKMEYEVVGEASDGFTAIKLAQKLTPDLIILDISMPNMTGLQAITEINDLRPPIKVMILSMHDSEEYIRQFLKLGVVGYLLKDTASEELLAAIAEIRRGGTYFSAAIASRMTLRKSSGDAPLTRFEALTRQELKVLKMLAEGRSNKEIAALLFISPKTVETHRTHIMKKLDLHDITDLVRLAIKMNLIEV